MKIIEFTGSFLLVLCQSLSFTARTCSTSTPPNRGTYDKTTVPFGEKVTLTCQWTATETRTRTAVCIYEGGTTRLAGDDITSCPGKVVSQNS